MSANKMAEFGALIGAQFSALVEAEIIAAEQTSEFIEQVGFEKREDGQLALRMVTFQMERRDSDNVARPHIIQIPALTLIPIPLLTIDSATIDFSVVVEKVLKVKETNNTIPHRFNSLRRKLDTRLARNHGHSANINADMNVSVKLAQGPLPLGYEKLLNIADLSTSDETEHVDTDGSKQEHDHE